MSANAVILVALTIWVLRPESTGSDIAFEDVMAQAAPSGEAPAEPTPPTKEEILAIDGVRFGLSAPQVPYSRTELATLSKAAGAAPTVLQFFLKWNQNLRPEAIALAYEAGALPVISWEPWEGPKAGENQPKYALSKIASGKHDAYITQFAETVRDQGYPVGLRFAHEMNGHWYPWSERRSGNEKGDYVKAWRHVHDTFQKVGATNVIWIWSPNILRPVPNVSLKALYPGDKYVDWAAMVGYAVQESTAAAVFEPTIRAIARFTDKPILITETGAQPSSRKTRWITDFFSWLREQENLVGFIWFEFSVEQGGTADWRFSADTRYAKAFRQGMSTVPLAPPPQASER